ncbi:MAG: 3D domain-containing protein [Lachnospiraceae bacterium]|nr:3D domain-containing protein [Lachnospiraceae bacterium]
MKKTILSGCKTLLITLTAAVSFAFPAMAASIHGEISSADSHTISGWAWNKEDTNDVQTVEVHIFQSGGTEPVKYLHVLADDYREDLVVDLKDGWHGFSAEVDWSQIKGDSFKIKAYAVKDGNYYTLGETVSYTKSSKEAAPEKTAEAALTKKADETALPEKPAAPVETTLPEKPADPLETRTQEHTETTAGAETSLGIFTTSGYCNCFKCNAGGHTLTFSGTVPQANHTISADLSILPIGSRVRIGDAIYTVEDKGGSVVGNIIDIYYADHDSAISHGLQKQEVFLIR